MSFTRDRMGSWCTMSKKAAPGSYASGSRPSVIARSMLDEDIRTFYEQPWVMVASDGGIGLRHPRSAGTSQRVASVAQTRA